MPATGGVVLFPGRGGHRLGGTEIQPERSIRLRSGDFSLIAGLAGGALAVMLIYVLFLRAGILGVGLLLVSFGVIYYLYVTDIANEEGEPGFLRRSIHHMATAVHSFIKWRWRNATLIWAAASTLVLLILPRFEQVQLCASTAGNATDSNGDSCAWYTRNTGTNCGGWQDTEDFKANSMCCMCGGGEVYFPRIAIALVVLLCSTLGYILIGSRVGTAAPTRTAEPDGQELESAGQSKAEPGPPGEPGPVGIPAAADMAAAARARTALDTATCVVCLTNSSNHALLPCGHMCICQDCVSALARNANNRCPVCRADVIGAARIFT